MEVLKALCIMSLLTRTTTIEVVDHDSCLVSVICDGNPNWMKIANTCYASTCKETACGEKINNFKKTLNPELEHLQNQINQLQSLANQLKNLTSCENATMDKALSWNGTGGIFNIYPENFSSSIEVYCDLTSDGGGWTVFQRRMDGSVDFYRGWDDYVNGFGEKDKEFWLGLETIYQLTKNGNYELRVDIGDWQGESRYAEYGNFSIAGSDDNYTLTAGDYSGTAGDSLAEFHNGRQFTTKDRDNDEHSDGNCAVEQTGAWWYGKCHFANLNGVYHVGENGSISKNVVWFHWRNTHDYSYKFTEMKFRKKQN